MFRFKQFTIHQDRCPMKVGTDGVLLGAWARVLASDRRILDIGTGTGVIALMLAQRSVGAHVTGVDVSDVSQARENAEASPWAERVVMVQSPVQAFHADPFDLIVSNPPYFVDSLTCPDVGRTTARHTTELSFADLHDAVNRLLATDGRFCLILPAVEMGLFLAVNRTLSVVRCTEVHSKPDSGVVRVLTEFVRRGHESSRGCLSQASAGFLSQVQAPVQPEIDSLAIGTGTHEEYTAEYRTLTRDFYLKF